jgi:molybdopterin converting factor subunit 1
MRILLFAQLKEAAGASEFELPVSRPLSLEEFWAAVIAAKPELAKSRAVVRVARNGEYAPVHVRFEPGDEVALIPPVSGG